MAYRIISFDGGGIAGMLTVVLLERLQAERSEFIGEADLLAGTSTGGLIALSLAAGKSLETLHKFYHDQGHRIFKRRPFLGHFSVFKARYSNDGLRELLTEQFGDMTLGDLSKRVLVPAFDCDGSKSRSGLRRWKAKFYHNFGEDEDRYERVVDVGMRTSAAPTYFPACGYFVDGGVVANNPSACALAQCQDPTIFSNGDCPKLEDVRMLSLGTGGAADHIDTLNLDKGFAYWGKKILPILFDGIADVPDYLCRSFLRERYARLNPIVEKDKLPEMDDWKHVDQFIEIAENTNIAPVVDWLKKTW